MTTAELDTFCLQLIGTTTDVKWGNDLCYCVGEKMYCVVTLNGPPKVSFKVTEEEFAELIEKSGIIPAPYVAKYHWVLVEDLNALKASEWKKFVLHSYEMVFEKLPKKVRDSVNSKPTRKKKD